MRTKGLGVIGLGLTVALGGLWPYAVAAKSVPTVTTDTRSAAQPSMRDIQKRLLGLANYGIFDLLTFEVRGDTVVLGGAVTRGSLRKSAERSVAKVAGVRQVVNEIEVLPPSGFDDTIRRDTYRAIFGTGGLYRYALGVNPPVRILVKGGRVKLVGYVANRGDYNLMNIAARGVSGVFEVTNNLIIESEEVK